MSKFLSRTLLGALCVLLVYGAFFSPAGAPIRRVAGRYYIRNRTQNFYQRATPRSNHQPQMQYQRVEPQKPKVETALPSDDSAELLAGRYYIRNRTSSFYRRAGSRS